jgi:hypothetical protein
MNRYWHHAGTCSPQIIGPADSERELRGLGIRIPAAKASRRMLARAGLDAASSPGPYLLAAILQHRRRDLGRISLTVDGVFLTRQYSHFPVERDTAQGAPGWLMPHPAPCGATSNGDGAQPGHRMGEALSARSS